MDISKLTRKGEYLKANEARSDLNALWIITHVEGISENNFGDERHR